LATAGFYSFNASRSKQDIKTQPCLIVDEAHLDFGTVWEDTQFNWTLPITNTTDEDILIDHFASSCVCLFAHNKSLLVPGHATREVAITVDFRRAFSREAISDVWPFEVRVAPLLAQRVSVRPPTWTLRGTVCRLIDFSPPLVDLGRIVTGAQASQSHNVVISTHSPVRTIKASCDSTLASVSVTSSSVPNQFVLTITPQTTLPVGRVELETTLQIFPLDGKQVPHISFFSLATVVTDVQATPASVLFGTRQLGYIGEETVIFSSASDQLLELQSVEYDRGDLEIQPLRIDDRTRLAFRIRQKITRLGKLTTTAIFTFRSPATQTVATIPVDITYRGVKITDVSRLQ
jgi:hypothetical protein